MTPSAKRSEAKAITLTIPVVTAIDMVGGGCRCISVIRTLAT
ncbi:hypothetical protein [Mycolicibacterium vulneris]|nr:hypothetical protein [Mycolicibacterium vulneris]